MRGREAIPPPVLLLLILLLAACGPAASRPNVVLLVWDCGRADRCSVNGYEPETTPALEAVARGGVTYRNAWAPGGWTGPTHASLFTGLLPQRHGFLLDNRLYLEHEETTLAELLAAEGYRTVCLTNNLWIGPKTGLSQGFVDYDSIASRPDAEYPTCRWEFARGLEEARRAKEDGVPLFLFINAMEAHLPFTPVEPFEARFVTGDPTPAELGRGRAFDTPDAVNHILHRERVGPRERRLLGDLYDAEIAGLDAEFGGFVEGLAAEGVLDDTMLVVTADHGENLGDHELYSHKVSLHRSIRNVPLVVRLPGRFSGGRTVDDVVRLEDLFPTILETCGVEPPEGIDGVSLTRDLAGRISRAAWGREGGNLTVPEVEDGADLTIFSLAIRAVFDGRHHLISYSDGSVELYDVAEDPEEGTDLSKTSPETVERLRPLLAVK